ncbi:MAG: flagellar basal body rod protein FlgB [Nitrospirae bacterium]|nr:MAG: flagellar basal body rod protein FlgB [Nitrospirota bacterium]
MKDMAIKRLEDIIRFTLTRHRVLAGNLANADTPYYRAKDISFESVVNEETLRLRATHPLHVREIEAQAGFEITEREDGTWLDKNNVEEDEEIAKMTENALLYQATLKLLNDRFKLYKSILSGR